MYEKYILTDRNIKWDLISTGITLLAAHYNPPHWEITKAFFDINLEIKTVTIPARMIAHYRFDVHLPQPAAIFDINLVSSIPTTVLFVHDVYKKTQHALERTKPYLHEAISSDMTTGIQQTAYCLYDVVKQPNRTELLLNIDSPTKK